MATDKKKDKLPEMESSAVAAVIHGDILEFVFRHVPLIDLVPASYVSKHWKRTVSTSLRCFNKVKPWLILHTQAIMPPYSITLHAYDPRSNVWIQIKQKQEINSVPSLRSSHSTLLYILSPSKISFSFDPLHLTWHQIEAPYVWRIDPIVALLGHRLIVGGGVCDFEDDRLAVEMYDLNTSTWETCESLPQLLKHSAASIWLSVAVNGNRMYVAEKCSGMITCFDPETKSWQELRNSLPDKYSASNFTIGFSNERLILIGLIGDEDDKAEKNMTAVKLWELNVESLEVCREIGEMPKDLFEKMEENYFRLGSASVTVLDDFVYINSTNIPRVMYICELGGDGGGGACKWSSVKNLVVNQDCLRVTDRLVFSCANVGLDDLNKAMVAQGRKFNVVGNSGGNL